MDEPYSWKKGRVVFVNSMSDLFHEDIDVDFIQQVFSVMNANQRHTFQVLTKRSDRLGEIAPLLEWSDNIWMGVTIENNDYVHRADDLRNVDAAVRFLSLEPLLGALPDLDLSGIDWAIVGGESGPGARPIEAEWVRAIREQCVGQDVEFFFKQWGGVNKKKNGRLLDGKTWDGMPELNRELCLA